MVRRSLFTWFLLCSGLALPHLAFGQGAKVDGGPVERSVVLKDGGMYRGEVVEYAVNSHVTLKLASGEAKRFAWDEIEQLSPPRPKAAAAKDNVSQPSSVSPPPPPPVIAPAPEPAPFVTTGTERTVTTRDNITYFGEVLEYEVGSHLTLKLADGRVQRLSWGEAKRISPARKKGDRNHLGSPERTLVLRDGKTLHGELVETIAGVHTTLRLSAGEIRRVLWSDIVRITAPLAPGTSSPIPLTGELLVHVDSGSRLLGTFFEYVPEQQLILRHASGKLYYIPVNTIVKVTIVDGPK